MAAYQIAPPRWRLVAWAAARWPADAARIRRWPLARLRAVWHKVNAARYAGGPRS